MTHHQIESIMIFVMYSKTNRNFIRFETVQDGAFMSRRIHSLYKFCEAIG